MVDLVLDEVARLLNTPLRRQMAAASGVLLIGIVVIILNDCPGCGAAPAPTSTPAATRTSPAATLVSTVRPTGTSTPAMTPSPAAWRACKADYLSRLHIQDRAYVSSQPPLANRVRAKPNGNANVIGQIEPGEKMTVLDGPSCANGWVWWYVQKDGSKLKGWTAEGDDNGYWLIPLAPTSEPAASSAASAPTDPEEFIRSYFAAVWEQRNYEALWALQTPAFQTSSSPGGYGEYVDWWSSVERVVVNSVSIERKSATWASADVVVTFSLTGGHTLSNREYSYDLTYNEEKRTWMFDIR